MIAKLQNDRVNGCQILKPTAEGAADIPYCTDVIALSDDCQIGVELGWDDTIRIHGVITTDIEPFIKMVDTLVVIARRYGYDRIYYTDTMSDEIFEMCMVYGFIERRVIGDPYNTYLELPIGIFTEEGGFEYE